MFTGRRERFSANPACAFRADKRPLVFWAELALLVLMAAILVWALALVRGSDLSEVPWLKLGIVIAFVPLALRSARQNRPRRLAPDAIPPEVLPEPAWARRRESAGQRSDSPLTLWPRGVRPGLTAHRPGRASGFDQPTRSCTPPEGFARPVERKSASSDSAAIRSRLVPNLDGNADSAGTFGRPRCDSRHPAGALSMC